MHRPIMTQDQDPAPPHTDDIIYPTSVSGWTRVMLGSQKTQSVAVVSLQPFFSRSRSLSPLLFFFSPSHYHLFAIYPCSFALSTVIIFLISSVDIPRLGLFLSSYPTALPTSGARFSHRILSVDLCSCFILRSPGTTDLYSPLRG